MYTMRTIAALLLVLPCALGANNVVNSSVGIGPNAPTYLLTAKNLTILTKPARNAFFLCNQVSIYMMRVDQPSLHPDHLSNSRWSMKA